MSFHSHSPVPAGHLPGIPTHSRSSAATPSLRCCCGRPECTFLANNHLVLEGLEKDLETAARLGQALLHRHESYMAEAEVDRRRLHSDIEQLERQKRQVEAENVRIIEENRGLLEQLEGLNKSLADSDSHAKSLTATLESTEAELRKVTAAAARADDLEVQLSQLETEQSKLQETLSSTEEDGKSAVQRWKKAESMIQSLQDQVERIEKEAREERERHSEMVQRMERRRVVERELDGAAGRLKGAAAAQELGRNPNGTNVVSRFVRDILQDNANLQMGIMELREMLDSSNHEVQNLRDQVLAHQPLNPTEDGAEPVSTTLSQELESSEARRVAQEFHIHHHYHSPSVSAASRRDRAGMNRRSKKRRSLLASPAILHSASSTPLSRKSLHNYNPSTSSTSTMMSQASVSIPPGAASSRRWSSQSPAVDSLASSPQSGYRTSSLFDRVDRGFDSSRPTSPDSTVFSSPLLSNRHRKSDASSLAMLGMDGLDQPTNDELLNLDYDAFGDEYDAELADGVPIDSVIPEETEDGSSVHYAGSECGLHPAAQDDVFGIPTHTPHKCPSRESLFSVAGMDIHTPSNRPSRMSRLHPTVPVRFPRRIASPTIDMTSTLPVISTTTATADRGAGQKLSEHTPQSLLASVSAPKNKEVEPQPDQANSESSESTIPTRKVSLSRRVGSWVRGRWGTSSETPDKNSSESQSETEAQPSQQTPDSSVTSTPIPSRPSSAAGAKQKDNEAPSGLNFRYPGVNQSGPIKGFKPRSRAPSAIHAEVLDENLLRESLAE